MGSKPKTPGSAKREARLRDAELGKERVLAARRRRLRSGGLLGRASLLGPGGEQGLPGDVGSTEGRAMKLGKSL